VETLQIIPYQDKYREAIKTLNEEWLLRYFKLEAKDIQTLGDPQRYIIDAGGFIFYAKKGNAIVGSVALLLMENGIYELSKMAVTAAVQGQGVGKKLLEHSIQFAREINATHLMLYSNTQLTAALALYKSYGFIEQPLEPGTYERADIKMKLEIQPT
jgi:ribosomal protein S18 acetylase RimI-like enzyme